MMYKLFWLAGIALISNSVCAEPARLNLSITAAVGASNGKLCVAADSSVSLAADSLILTEHDVLNWNPVTGVWVLDPNRYAELKDGWGLADHCYELHVDGKLISQGIVLWSHSARLVRFPTLTVTKQNKQLSLQLRSGHWGGHEQLILRDQLGGVLHNTP